MKSECIPANFYDQLLGSPAKTMVNTALSLFGNDVLFCFYLLLSISISCLALLAFALFPLFISGDSCQSSSLESHNPVAEAVWKPRRRLSERKPRRLPATGFVNQ
jgi:hypothetical protein